MIRRMLRCQPRERFGKLDTSHMWGHVCSGRLAPFLGAESPPFTCDTARYALELLAEYHPEADEQDADAKQDLMQAITLAIELAESRICRSDEYYFTGRSMDTGGLL